MPSKRSQSYSLVKTVRQEEMARKKDERIQRATTIQQQKKMDSYLADDQNFHSFSAQLTAMGLQMRDIPGDGNCLFRALGDQLEGHCRNHHKHRLEVVQYMFENRKDFEPFVEDDISFDKHLQMLKKPGTFGGNDVLVAFARLYRVNIVIHQLNSPVWQIHGTDGGNARELHITYHNGEHYSSVRRLGDNTESPSSIKLRQPEEEDKNMRNSNTQSGYSSKHTGTTQLVLNGSYTEMPNTMGMARVVRKPSDVERNVMSATGCTDATLVREMLEEKQYDVDSTIHFLVHIMANQPDKSSPRSSNAETASLSSHQTTDSGIWSDSGTRVYGRQDSSNSECDRLGQHNSSSSVSSGYDSCNGAKPKVSQEQHVSNKKKKEINKKEKKKRAEERHRQKIGGTKPQFYESDDDTVIISKDLAMLKV